jgi:hypothetical protein
MKIVYIKVTLKIYFQVQRCKKPQHEAKIHLSNDKKSIGQVVERFEDNIHFSLKVVKVEQI